MLILAVMLAYLGALGRHLGPKLLQLGPQEASRWILENVFFDVFWELFADVAGDPPKTPKMTPKWSENGLKMIPETSQNESKRHHVCMYVCM